MQAVKSVIWQGSYFSEKPGNQEDLREKILVVKSQEKVQNVL